MNTQEKNRRALEAIAARHAAASSNWMFSDAGAGETMLTAFDPTTGLDEQIARCLTKTNSADIEFLAAAHGDIADLLKFVAVARNVMAKQSSTIAQLRGAEPRRKSPKNYATNATMMLNERPFRLFLQACHGMQLNETLTQGESAAPDCAAEIEAATAFLREILQIESRIELNDPESPAVQRWQTLSAEFRMWERAA